MSEHLQILPVSLTDFQQLVGEERLYAVFDACDEPAVLEKVKELGPSRAFCLYHGEVSPEILEIAPYLTLIDEALLQWLIENIWGEPWGIFIVAKLEPKLVRKHLRKFLTIQDETEGIMYFRYYDPRVLLPFLDSCEQGQLDVFFGRMEAFGYAEDHTPGYGSLIIKKNKHRE